MPTLRQRVLDAAGVDDSWERPRPEIGRQDVVLAAGIGVLALLSLELVRSSNGLDRTDAPVWAQWLVAVSGALLLLGRRRWPLVVVILTTFDRDDYLFDALDAGASGFLLKNAGPEQLLEAVRVVGHGHALLAPEVTRRVIGRRAAEGGARPPARPAELDHLTAREGEVLVMLGRGLSNAEIAEELVLREATVKTHVSNVLGKLQLRDRVQAVVYAYEAGLILVTED